MDEAPPSRVVAIFAGAGKRPYAMLRLSDRCEVHDLELRKKVATFLESSRISFDGNVAVISNDLMVATIDPDSEKPQYLLRRPPESTDPTVQDDLPQETLWKWPKGLERSGQLRAAVHGDSLFYLKCARSLGANASIGSRIPPIDRVSLLYFKPHREEPLEIPLSFQPEAVKKFLAQTANVSRLTYPPELCAWDLRATSAGLFFNFNVISPIGTGSGYSPGLLYVPWKDVNDWLTRHGHTPIGTRLTKEATPIPK